jgi:hypothetical protein
MVVCSYTRLLMQRTLRSTHAHVSVSVWGKQHSRTTFKTIHAQGLDYLQGTRARATYLFACDLEEIRNVSHGLSREQALVQILGLRRFKFQTDLHRYDVCCVFMQIDLPTCLAVRPTVRGTCSRFLSS